jgi:hypothetical protein
MTAEELGKTFGAKHHALLFAWMSREVIRRIGAEKGEAVIRKAVQRYGRQRGGRMAMRAQADGQTQSMFNFLIYGEWEASDRDFDRLILETNPHFHIRVARCPWNDTWLENDLLPYGRLYCLEVDRALIQGFNPDLTLEVNTTLPNDQCDCDFIYQEAHLTPENFRRMEQRRQEVHDAAIMPWDYHLGHLYKTISEEVIDELGEAGEEAINAAMAEFTREFGEDTAEIVLSFKETDFDSLPK